MQNFKKLYKEYKENKTIESENRLLRSILFDYDFIVGYDKQRNTLNAYRSENNKLVVCFYSDLEEMEDELRNRLEKLKVNFDGIFEMINENLLDEICFNPNTDRLKLTNSQISDLYRQKVYNQTNEPVILHENKKFLKSAYKINELVTNSNKIIELYNTYLTENTQDNLSNFFRELVNNATFYACVLPEDDAETDENGHPLISNDRVLQYNSEKYGKQYCLFISIKNAIDFFGLDERNYVSIFNFDDIINMMDATHNTIKSLRIVGDLDLSIPAGDFYSLKVQKDNLEVKGKVVIDSQLADTEDNNAIIDALKKYFSKIEHVEKIWCGYEFYKVNVLKIYAKVNGEINTNIENDLRIILENRCFKLTLVNSEVTDNQLSLIYEK